MTFIILAFIPTLIVIAALLFSFVEDQDSALVGGTCALVAFSLSQATWPLVDMWLS